MDEGESQAREARRRNDRIGLALLASSAGWVAILFAALAFILRWRVVNEPGAGEGPQLLVVGVFSLSAGLLGFVGGQVALLRWGAGCRWLALVWGVALALSLGALLLSPMLLLLLV